MDIPKLILLALGPNLKPCQVDLASNWCRMILELHTFVKLKSHCEHFEIWVGELSQGVGGMRRQTLNWHPGTTPRIRESFASPHQNHAHRHPGLRKRRAQPVDAPKLPWARGQGPHRLRIPVALKTPLLSDATP